MFGDILGLGSPAFSTYIVNSSEITDSLIADFCKAIDRGEDPNDVKYDIFAMNNVSTDDLTDYDKERLVETVQSYAAGGV